jgi:F1F0 ATPase subunit 2
MAMAMAMNDIVPLAPALLAGLLLGALFFGGLWWTLRKGLSSPRPAGWMLGSLVLRTGLVLAGFYLVGGDHWERLVAALLGFLIARLVVTRLAAPATSRDTAPAVSRMCWAPCPPRPSAAALIKAPTDDLQRSPRPEATHASES